MNEIKRPIITEKSMALASTGWYTFAVALAARKEDIVKSINTLYSVNVTEVRTMRVAGKTQKAGKKMKPITRMDWKYQNKQGNNYGKERSIITDYPS
jgi:ribosomal protein L23